MPTTISGTQGVDQIKDGTIQQADFAAGVPNNLLGVGQTWQDVTRVSGTTYTNETGKPIQWVFTNLSSGTLTSVTIGGVNVLASVPVPAGTSFWGNFIIPVGATYSYVNGSANLTNHKELR